MGLVLRRKASNNLAVTFGRGMLIVASLLGVWLSVEGLWGRTLPAWVLLSALLSYLGLVVLGVMSPRLQMFGQALCFVPGARGMLALTFDDGPDPASTPLVLSALQAAGATGTFFLVGQKVDKYPDLAARIVSEGHQIAAHSYDHNRMYAFLSADVVQADIERTCASIERATGVRPTWFRPPVGQMSPPTALGIERARMRVAGWSVRPFDGVPNTTPEQVKRRVIPRLKAGAIVLLHDAPEFEREGANPPAGVLALPELLVACDARGLRCVSLDVLVSNAAEDPRLETTSPLPDAMATAIFDERRQKHEPG